MEVVVFTNGCFDIIHPGHTDLLERARAFGTKLVVGINSDRSVRAIKGEPRPFMPQEARAAVLRALRSVDEVRIFDEPTPARIIEEIKPDVLVKGGDWTADQIVGADFVLKNGGRVFSLPLKDGYSSSSLVEKIQSANKNSIADELAVGRQNTAAGSLRQHIEVFRNLLSRQLVEIESCARMIYETLEDGKKILICGNGGSAADAQHIAAEFVGRYEAERRGFPAVALTTDTSALTALGNDYGFEKIFSRQIEALAVKGDLLIALSTSGNSPNILSAVMKARELGCRTLGLTGRAGKKLAALCDACILVPSERTARIQEAHIAIAHLWCEFVDEKLTGGLKERENSLNQFD
jgi:D-sedoheptulose 7-phosphate isomerase